MSDRFIEKLFSLKPENVVVDTDRLIQATGYRVPDHLDETSGVFHKGYFYISNIESLAYLIKNMCKNCTYKGKMLSHFNTRIHYTDSHLYFRSLGEQTNNIPVIEDPLSKEVSNQNITVSNEEYIHVKSLNIVLSKSLEGDVIFVFNFDGYTESDEPEGSYSFSMKYRDLIQYC